MCTGAATPPQNGHSWSVPSGFSAADLPAVDMSTAGRAHSTVVAAFKQRFTELRKQVHYKLPNSFGGACNEGALRTMCSVLNNSMLLSWKTCDGNPANATGGTSSFV